ncbi:MAG: hypothetical protein P1V51_06420 [Deltaproteobacteria bacterium]|nr:hypothetical protein [Deltaproteobacteria bacterium]
MRLAITNRGSSLLSCLLLGLSLTACPFGSAELRRGDDLAAKGLWRQASAAYAAALEKDPRDAAAQSRLAEAERQLAAELAREVEPALNLGELARADGLFLEAEALDAGSPALAPLRPRLARAHLDQVIVATGAGELDRAFHAADRAADLTPDDPEAVSVLSAARHAYSDELSREAQRHLREGRPGNALVSLLRLEEVAPGENDVVARIFDARLAAREANGYATELQVSAGGAARRRVAVELVRTLGALEDNATCEGLELVRVALEGPGASLRLAVENYAVLSQRKTRTEQKRYVAGSRRVPNPAKAEAAEAVTLGQAKLEAAVAEYKAALGKVSEREIGFAEAPPESDTEQLRQALSDARQTASGARQAAEAAAKELGLARRRLADTPKMIDQAIEKEVELEIADVTRRAELEVRIAAKDLETGELAIPSTILRAEASTEDSTHRALPRAQIEADPLVFPKTDEELEQTILDQMSRQISERVLGLCQAHNEKIIEAPLQLSAGAPREERTEAWVKAILRSKKPIPPEAETFFTTEWTLSDLHRLRD